MSKTDHGQQSSDVNQDALHGAPIIFNSKAVAGSGLAGKSESETGRSRNKANETVSVADGQSSGTAPKRKQSNRDSLGGKAKVKKKTAIQTSGALLLHTQLAHNLFMGRKAAPNQYAITGLIQFSGQIRTIWESASLDDPYADMKLLHIEAAMDNAAELVRINTEVMNNLLDSLGDRIVLSDCRSERPVSVPISFRTPYGFMAARLLGDFDEMVICALKARHIGMILDQEWHATVSKTATAIRRVFNLSGTFNYSGATRNDFAANNQRAREAIAKYGELPQEVLAGTKRAKIAPPIKDQSVLRARQVNNQNETAPEGVFAEEATE
jgi:integrating conjugative element protein (TIGR03761 family)